MRKDINHFFTDFPFTFDNEPYLGGIRADVHETGNEVIATCDNPGLEKKEDVNIDIENNTSRIGEPLIGRMK